MKHLLRGLALLVVLSVALLAVVATTTTGLQWVLAGAERVAPGALTVGRVEGRLVGPLTLQDLHYRDAQLDLRLEQVELDWLPGALWRKSVHLRTVRARGIALQTQASDSEAEPFSFDGLPFGLRLQDIEVTQVELQSADGSESQRIDRLYLDAHLQGRRLELIKLSFAAPAQVFDGHGVLNLADHGSETLQMEWWLQLPDMPRLTGKGTLQGNTRAYELQQTLGGPVDAGLTATLQDALVALRWQVAADIRRLDLQALQPAGPLQAVSGAVTASGDLDVYEFNLQGKLDSADYPPLDVTAAGKGDRAGMTLSTLNGSSPKGAFAAQGKLAWVPDLQWQLQANVDAFDPGMLDPAWPGALTFTLDSDGRRGTDGWSGKVVLAQLKGYLRKYPLSGAVQAQFENDRLALQDVRLGVGAARIAASGKVDDAWDLQWNVNVPDLGELQPRAGGKLAGEGRIRGARATPQVLATLSADGVRLQGLRARSLNARLDVDLADTRESGIDVRGSGLAVSGQDIDTLSLQSSGRLSQHAIELDISSGTRTATARLAGGYRDTAWNGRVENLGLQLAPDHDWRLQRPATLAVSRARATLDELCLAHDQGSVCAQADWQTAQAWQLDVTGNALPLALLQPLFAQPVAIDSTLDVNIQANSSRDGPAATASIKLSPGSITFDDGEQTLELARIDASRLTAQLQRNVLTGELNMVLQDNGALSGRWQVRDIARDGRWLHPAAALDARLEVNLQDLGIVSVLVPETGSFKGQLAGKLALTGTVGKPDYVGEALLSDASTALPRIGLQLRDIEIQLAGGGDAIRLQGAATSGEGTLKISGRAQLPPGEPPVMDLDITGERVEVANIPEARVLASPDIDVSLRDRQLEVTGTLTVPEASIKVRDIKSSASESPDLVLVDASGTQGDAAAGMNIDTRVTVVLGDRVSFDGFGLNARLAGRVEISERSGEVTRARGDLDILDGEYAVYGTKLSVAQGRLVFAGGPIDNPGLNMRVVRTSGEVLAGVRVTGFARDPELRLFSEPTMDQADVLSYLLLGVPTSKASGAQGAALSGAAASLGLAGGDWLSKQLGDAFGIVEVGIESGETLEESSLVLGKYLSPRLYVNYAVGLFDQLNTFRLRYELSRRWSIQTETGAATSADLIFTLER